MPPAPPSPPRPRPFPWRAAGLAVVLAVGGLSLAWLQVSQSIADAAVERLPDRALAVKPGYAPALARKAELTLNQAADPETAERGADLARRALAADPLQSAAFRSLAIAAGRKGETRAEGRLMTIAGDRNKRDVQAGAWLVEDRMRAGRYAEAAERADGLLRAWPSSMQTSMTQQLSRMAEAPTGAVTLARLLDTEPPWRTRFLLSMAQRGDNPGAATSLYTAMRTGRKPPTEVESGALVGRLVKDGEYQRAFLVWANLLPDDGIRHLADPYDGGFEGLPGAPPFNWQFFGRGGTVVETGPAPEREGEALYLRFSDAAPAPTLARQLLALPQGRHILTGLARGERLSMGGRRLAWSMRCAEPGLPLRLVGPALESSGRWTPFELVIDVPPGCTAQWLMLSAPGRGKMAGEAWYDDLKITRGG